MRQLYTLLVVALLSPCFLSAQLNTTLRDNLDYPQTVNDVWGYAAPDGTEYAIVGTVTGVSFVSLADPDNIVEVAFIPGQTSTWRDMKTFGEYAYSVTDDRNSNEGITAYDLRFLPDSVPFQRTTHDLPGGFNPVRYHNLFIDTLDGVLVTAGGDRNIRDGGPIYYDITNDPMVPEFLAFGPPVYSHDVFVLNDTLYASELYRGDLALYDVSDYTNSIRLGASQTPFTFTHNAWTTADGAFCFTTDEEPNAPVASFDVRDKNDIQLLDEYRPFESLNTGTVPHNVHVIDEYLSISYYTDGLRVVDASVPDNLVEVANYDTWLGAPGDFNGAWGAYPFLPSGLTLISDLSTGLYVVGVDYKRAARLRGTVTDADTGLPINNVSVVITATQENGVTTDALGRYATGLAEAGTYTVTFSAPNYDDVVTDVDILSGETLVLDTVMQANVARFDIGLTVREEATNDLISGAQIRFVSTDTELALFTGSNGRATRPGVFDNETYDVFITNWGHRTMALNNVTAQDLQDITVFLPRGYMDDFVTDEGWRVTLSEAATGLWTRAVPNLTRVDGRFVAPDRDVRGDFGDIAWVTGNRIGQPGADDIDDGRVTFESPAFGPITNEDSMMVSYHWWFVNPDRGDILADDDMTISISNGTDTALVATYTGYNDAWTQDSFLVNDFVEVTDNLTLIVSAVDREDGHLVEAGFDAFSVRPIGGFAVSTSEYEAPNVSAEVFPNPNNGTFTLRYELEREQANLEMKVSDGFGRTIFKNGLGPGKRGKVDYAGNNLPRGIYLVQLLSQGRPIYTSKMIVQ